MNRRWTAAIVLLVLAACARSTGPAEPAVETLEPPAAVARVTSNILRDDYAGSRACADCHGDIYAAWKQSPMHRMTRLARDSAIEAPFDGATLQVGTDTATMETRGGKRYVVVATAADGRRLYRVTKVIGGRYREDYVGVDVTDAADPAQGWNVERVLPVSFVFADRSWRYKGYSVMVPERPELRVRVAWSQTCIGCHNTLPAITMYYDELAGPAAPAYQGRLSDDLLPPSRTWRIEPRDRPRLASAIADEVAHIGGKALDVDAPFPAFLRQAIAQTRTYFGGADLIEVGVGCEACHGGAAEHVIDSDVLPSFELRSPLLRAVPPTQEASHAQWVNRACVRCHTVLFTEYPWTWEGGRRDDALPGGSTTNSGEARDFNLGGCATQFSCVGCHDPHGADPPEAMARLATMDGNAVCAGCHPALATADGLRAHTHHAPGVGSACVACHMPKKNMGLAYELVRYHRIGSPTDAQRVLGDRPLECALCHRDKTVAQLVSTMERWWGKRYDRRTLAALYGDLDANVIDATLARGKPHEQAVAIGVLGELGRLGDIPALAPYLTHEYPLVRYYARYAIERLGGTP